MSTGRVIIRNPATPNSQPPNTRIRKVGWQPSALPAKSAARTAVVAHQPHFRLPHSWPGQQTGDRQDSGFASTAAQLADLDQHHPSGGNDPRKRPAKGCSHRSEKADSRGFAHETTPQARIADGNLRSSPLPLRMHPAEIPLWIPETDLAWSASEGRKISPLASLPQPDGFPLRRPANSQTSRASSAFILPRPEQPSTHLSAGFRPASQVVAIHSAPCHDQPRSVVSAFPPFSADSLHALHALLRASPAVLPNQFEPSGPPAGPPVARRGTGRFGIL